MGLRRFRHIVFPLIRNTALVLTVLTSIHAFNHVTLVFVMTGGGPVGSTEVMALRVFMEGFRFYHLGIASAGAVLMFLLNIAFTFASRPRAADGPRVMRRQRSGHRLGVRDPAGGMRLRPDPDPLGVVDLAEGHRRCDGLSTEVDPGAPDPGELPRDPVQRPLRPLPRATRSWSARARWR